MRACWLEGSDGDRVRIRQGGLMLGRGRTCDLLSGDLRASRRHAVVRIADQSPEVVPVGRSRTHVNGRSITETTALHAADILDIPGLSLKIVMDNSGGSLPSGWRVESAHATMPIHSTSFVVSGDLWADLHILGWSGAAVQFHLVDGALLVESQGEVLRNGVRLPVGYVGPVSGGDRFGTGDAAFVVTCEQRPRPAQPTGASRLRLESLPMGAWLTVEDALGPRRAWLTDAHRDLLTCLLQPPVPYIAGDLVPDSVVRATLWGAAAIGETGLNQRVAELRLFLVRAGINGLDLIERRAHQTRVCVEDDADVHLD